MSGAGLLLPLAHAGEEFTAVLLIVVPAALIALFVWRERRASGRDPGDGGADASGDRPDATASDGGSSEPGRDHPDTRDAT